MIYLDLFFGFLKVGLFSFGGAYGAIPLIREVVLSHQWITEDVLANMIAISESTPGPIMVNMATYVGSDTAGLLGAAIATFAVVLPAFLIILIVASLFQKALEHKWVRAMLSGIKPCIVGIILATGAYILLENCFYAQETFTPNLIIVCITIGLSVIYFGARAFRKGGISPLLLITFSAICGMIFLK